MPIYSPTGFLDVTNATLRTSNLEAENFKLNGGNIYVSTEFTPSLLVNGNVTSNIVQFTNATTGLVTTANVQVGGELTVNGATIINSPATIGTTKEFVVTASGGHFYIDGVQQDSLELHEGQTYLFDLTSTGTTHPFRLATVSDGGGGQPYSSNPASDYTTGTDYTSVANHLKFTVPVGAPSTLYYYCMNHTGMGGSISISTEAELIVSGRVVTSGNVEVGGNVTMIGTGTLTLPSGTTAQQPTGVEGMVRFNTSYGQLEYYDGTSWNTLSGFNSVEATGGTVTNVVDSGVSYRVHTFSTVGSSNFVVTKGGEVEYLIVAGGGGGGGRYHAGGGGGGGVLQHKGFTVTPQTYAVVVGDGGAAGLATPNESQRGSNGSNSSAFGQTALGGGGGGSNSTLFTGLSGGSGGGAAGSSNNATHRGGDGTSGQGHRGGNGLGSSTVNAERVGGGGGGAGGRAMHAAAYRTRDPGDGGPGIPSTISGTLTYYGAGGGGGGEGETNNMGLGGIGGGGNGGSPSRTETAGEDGKGAGGGGSDSNSNGVGNGGSGVVIIRYRI